MVETGRSKGEAGSRAGNGLSLSPAEIRVRVEGHESPRPRLYGRLERSTDRAHGLPTARHGIAARGVGHAEEVESDGLSQKATDTTDRPLDGSVRKRRNPASLSKCKRD